MKTSYITLFIQCIKELDVCFKKSILYSHLTAKKSPGGVNWGQMVKGKVFNVDVTSSDSSWSKQYEYKISTLCLV